jgi:phage gpG-like protein
MNYIEEELESLNNDKAQFSAIVDMCVMELQDEVREIIKARWLESRSVNGGNITNKETGEGYAWLSYKNYKLKNNPKGSGGVDLTLSGALGDSIIITRSIDGNYTIVATDRKYNAIGSKYGYEEFGLDQNEMQYVLGKLEKKITNKLNEII